MVKQMKWMLQTEKCRWFGYRKLEVKKKRKDKLKEQKKKFGKEKLKRFWVEKWEIETEMPRKIDDYSQKITQWESGTTN